MNQKYQIPIIIGILLLFVLLNPILFPSGQDVEISYKQFRDKLAWVESWLTRPS